jgi:hypothetical protein
MAKTSFTKKHIPPVAFSEHRRTAFARTVQLTQKALSQLHAQGKPVTLSAVSEATRAFDEKGKGLEPNTILRNPEAAKLFRQQSPAYQQRQARARQAKRKRPVIDAAVRATYRGLRPTELMTMAEDLKTQIIALKAQQQHLQVDRDEAHRVRDQALQQNTRQLAMLTQSMTQVQLSVKSDEPKM